MRLNHDCIRDILLYVEENINEQNDQIRVNDMITYMHPKYNEYMLNYHIIYLNQAHMFTYVAIVDDDIPIIILDLSVEGHNYVNNIRDNKVWSKLKELSGKLASVSLPILIEKAPEIAKQFLSNS